MDVPQSVKNYYDAQWWIFIHYNLPPLMIVVALGIIAFVAKLWGDAHEDEEQDSGLTVLSLGKEKDDGRD